MVKKHSHQAVSQAAAYNAHYLRTHFDGGLRDNSAGAGWMAETSTDGVAWSLAATGTYFLGGETSIAAELEAAWRAVRCSLDYITTIRITGVS